MSVHRTRPQVAAPAVPDLPRLPYDGAMDILCASQSPRGAARTILAAMLLKADRYGVVTGYTREFAKAAGVEKDAAWFAMARLAALGEITQIRRPSNRRPGMWHITALR